MISSIGGIVRRSASKHKSEMKFEFGFEVVVEVMIEVVVVASPLVRELRQACNERQKLRGFSSQPSYRSCLLCTSPAHWSFTCSFWSRSLISPIW